MEYRIVWVDDERMPEGRLWVMCRASGETRLYLARSVRSMPEAEESRILVEAWAGFREMVECDDTTFAYSSSATASV